MRFLPKVKCSQCNRSYPGLKNKCPHCGTGRTRKGKRVADVGDGQVRMIIRGLILLTLIITVISAVAIDLDAEPQRGSAAGGSVGRPADPAQTQENEPEENEPTTIAPPPVDLPPPTPPPVAVTAVDFHWRFKVGNINEMTLRIGDEIEVTAEVFPIDASTDDIRWTTSEGTICNITVDPNDHTRVTLLARGAGNATITVTVGGVSNDLIVRVRS